MFTLRVAGRGFLVAVATLAFSVPAAQAVVIVATEAAGVNNDGGLGGVGTHFHTAVGSSAGVNYSFDEEGRGMAEFNIAGIGAFSSAVLSFRVSAFLDDFGTSNPFIDPIDVLGYLGNNDVTVSDFQAATFGLIGNFATIGLSIGDIISFDVTTALQAGVLGGTNSLGVLFDPTTQTGTDHAIQFNQITITTTAATVPVPGTLGLLWLGVAGLAFHRRRRTP